MLRNNKGYLLLEAMLSLMLFTAVFSVCLPFIYVSFQEKRSSQELLYAMTEADTAAANSNRGHFEDNEREWVKEGIRYHLITKKGVLDEYESCITFTASNQREYKTCASSYQSDL
jgi:hypothetical protein